MPSLEELLQSEFIELGAKEDSIDSVTSLLQVLKIKDNSTYEHSMRVALLGSRIAKYMNLDPKVLLFAGALHDIGKILIPPEILQKTEGFDERDMRIMRKHPEYTYDILRGIHEFSAEVALRHHRYQKNGYPKKLPRFKIDFSTGTRTSIDFYARLLALTDFYDAVTSRINDKFGERRKLTQEEAKSIMLMQNPDQRALVEKLYANAIFGDEEATVKEPAVQDALYESLWKNWQEKRSPRETRRHVVIACSLEPLSEKYGCTTRASDVSPHLKLEYFIVGAVNIGDAFEDLARRVQDWGKQPKLIYDTAYRAQEECKRNRCGGRVNQGIIEMLVPIITSQQVFDADYAMPAEKVLDKAVEVMKSTSREDVDELVKMKRLANRLCEYYDRDVPEHPDSKNVYDYYSLDLESSVKPTSIKHNGEFVHGFPAIREIYENILRSQKRIFNRKIEDAYAIARGGMHRDVSVGLTADCVAAAIYLVLSNHPKERIVR